MFQFTRIKNTKRNKENGLVKSNRKETPVCRVKDYAEVDSRAIVFLPQRDVWFKAM